jgi:hypothetical protein
MARAQQGEVVYVAPSSNIYTVFVIIAFLLGLLSVALMFLKYQEYFGKTLPILG